MIKQLMRIRLGADESVSTYFRESRASNVAYVNLGNDV